MEFRPISRPEFEGLVEHRGYKLLREDGHTEADDYVFIFGTCGECNAFNSVLFNAHEYDPLNLATHLRALDEGECDCWSDID